jgi:hypothetical protein
MKPENTGYFSFLLRLWQEKSKGQLVWRASLESPSDSERVGFANIDELISFLAKITQINTSQNEANSTPKSDENR